MKSIPLTEPFPRPTSRSPSLLWFGLLVGLTLSQPNDSLAQEQQAKSPTRETVHRVIGFDRFSRHEEIDPGLAGRLLISELSCVACHPSESVQLQPKRGPILTGAGVRIRKEWIVPFLIDPAATHPQSTMPDVLASLPDAERIQAAEALVAFLSTQQTPFAEVKAGGASPVIHEFWNHGDVERGAQLYHSTGCVACHEPDQDYETAESKPSAIDELIDQLDPEELEDLGLAGQARRVPSIGHPQLAEKYSYRSLTMFLLDPAKTRPSARMPVLRLAPVEAADIAAYLLRDEKNVPADLQKNDDFSDQLVERGKRLFGQLGCAACHEAKGAKQTTNAKPLASLDSNSNRSCIGQPQGSMPRYRLDDFQRNAIRTALSSTSQRPLSVSEHVQLTMLQLNCFACHRRDELGGVGRYRKPYFETFGNVDLGDEGRLPPSLDAVGRKLRAKALAAVFQPRTAKHRTYMRARMPSYATPVVGSLVKQFPIADQLDSAAPKEVFSPMTKLEEPGRLLIDTGCVGCHTFRGEALPGVVGIDLYGITNRLHPRWFYDFVRDPNEIKNRSRMPTFFPGGKSNRPDILDGDVHQQISSIWAYLSALDRLPLPEKIEAVRSANYELSPSERPVLLRTFMQDVGTHAIAVGYRERIHIAFDAEQARLALAWKGRFMDARSTWFERFAPPVEPLEEHRVRFPELPLIKSEFPWKPEFKGYRLDPAGVPTFLYRFGPLEVSDRINPKKEGTLLRTLFIEPNGFEGSFRLQLHAAKMLEKSDQGVYMDSQGLQVIVPGSNSEKLSLTRSEELEILTISCDGNESLSLEWEYRW